MTSQPDRRHLRDVPREDPVGRGGGSFCSNPACHGRKWPEMNLDPRPPHRPRPRTPRASHAGGTRQIAKAEKGLEGTAWTDPAELHACRTGVGIGGEARRKSRHAPAFFCSRANTRHIARIHLTIAFTSSATRLVAGCPFAPVELCRERAPRRRRCPGTWPRFP